MKRVLLALLLALPMPTTGMAGPARAADGRSCRAIEAMITERVQDMGIEFSRRVDRMAYPPIPPRKSSRPDGPPLPIVAPRPLTIFELYDLKQKVRARPGQKIVGLQARVETDLTALAGAGCPAYALPTDIETYSSAAELCDTARIMDDTDRILGSRGERIESREPEYVTATACDRARWSVGEPMSLPY